MTKKKMTEQRSLKDIHDKGVIGDTLYNDMKSVNKEIKSALKQHCRATGCSCNKEA